MYRLCPFYYFTICTRIEYKQGSEDVYQEEIRFEELCPHVHNSIEFLPMSLFFQGSQCCLWSWKGPWNNLWSYCGSRVVLSLNTSSISVSRDCSSSLILEDGSDSQVSNVPSIGRGGSSSPLFSASLWNDCSGFSLTVLDDYG